MNPTEYALNLVREAFNAIDLPAAPLGPVIQQCIRVARLRSDFDNLWWLELEMISLVDVARRAEIEAALRPHYSAEAFQQKRRSHSSDLLVERLLVGFNDVGQGAATRTPIGLIAMEIRSLAGRGSTAGSSRDLLVVAATARGAVAGDDHDDHRALDPVADYYGSGEGSPQPDEAASQALRVSSRASA